MEIINALEYLRSKEIVHRDLKPKNILIDDSFHVKLADFGAAKHVDPKEISQMIEQFCKSDDESSENTFTENDGEESDDSPMVNSQKVKNT